MLPWAGDSQELNEYLMHLLARKKKKKVLKKRQVVKFILYFDLQTHIGS